MSTTMSATALPDGELPAGALSDGGTPVGSAPQLDASCQATAVSTETLAAHLTALSDAEVAALLTTRADLLSPPSSSFTMLAARAGARPSVEIALAGLNAAVLAVAEAVVATGAQDPDLLGPALLLSSDDVAAHLATLRGLALVLDSGPVAGLVEALGPHPLGLAPAAAPGEGSPDAPLPPSLQTLHDAAQQAGSEQPEPPPATPVLPPAALAVLDALTWGPPAGTLREGGQAPGAALLVERGWLERTHDDSSGTTRFLLPRRVALALRGGRLLRRPPTAPDPAVLPAQDPAAVADQASRAAEEAVRLVAALLDEWGREGGPVLRTGGVGVRALARTADTLGLANTPAARVIELAAGADLLGLDDAGATWVPSTQAPLWRATTLPERWAPLAIAWAGSARPLARRHPWRGRHPACRPRRRPRDRPDRQPAPSDTPAARLPARRRRRHPHLGARDPHLGPPPQARARRRRHRCAR